MIYLKRFGLLLAMAGIFMSFSVGSVFAQEKEDRGTDQKMERGQRDRDKEESRTIRSRSNRRRGAVHSRRSISRQIRYTARNSSRYNRRHKTDRHEKEGDNDKN